MNRLLIAFLVLSLACNAWFALNRQHPPQPSAPPAAATSAPRPPSPTDSHTLKGATTSDGVAGVRPFFWKNTDNSIDSLRVLAAELRAAGMPADVAARVVGELLRDRLFGDIAKLPHWQLMAPGRELRRRQSEMARELLRLQEEIVGPEGAAIKTLDPTLRRLDYGDLSDAKATALLRLERDYQDLAADLLAFGGAVSREEFAARNKAREDLQKEKLADIAAALSPEEFADYERRRSPAAARTQRGLRDLTLGEEAYLALLDIEKARDAYNEFETGIIGTVPPEKLAYMDKVLAVLGAEQANAYLKTADFSYGMVARFSEKYPAVTPAKTYELYKLQGEAQAAMMSNASGAPRDPEKLRATMTDLNARLDTLLGAEVAAAYRAQGSGGVFNSFRPRPTTNATPPKG